MRQKQQDILSGFFHDDDNENKTLQIVRQFRDEYKRIDDQLQKYPEILEAAHRDLEKLCKPDSTRDRQADFTSENLFRAVLVVQVEGIPYRETTVRIAESQTLQNFCRLEKKETINHSLICSAFNAISPETWQTINQSYALRMKQEEKIDTDNIRIDTTVVETNIHYPTDSSLLWDTYRTIDRIWTRAHDLGLSLVLPDFRLHPEKIRKLHLDITRFSASKDGKRKRLVRSSYATLIERTSEALLKAKEIAMCLKMSNSIIAVGLGFELESYFPAMEKVIHAARRRHAGEKVPNEDKVFSIFESHTELIQRGKRDKPIEFGHKIMLSQTVEKFITDYEVFLRSPSDTKLLEPAVERHEELFQEYPSGVAGDMGFYPGKDEFDGLVDDYDGKVNYFGVPGRLCEFGDALMSTFQRWRAGIEGTISCLKRVFRLSRCHFKGFKNFCCGVGSAIFCHNVLTMVRHEMVAESPG
jgi:IS5 family transposase